MALPTSPSFPPGAKAIARAYASLEGGLRRVIDRVAAAACPRCASPCCRVHYCRETARNPWYRFVNETAGAFALPADWETRRDPFGLGARGCGIRAGRYAFCYSYNCPRLLATLQAHQRALFQELSDLALSVNRLPNGCLLHEIRTPKALGPAELAAIAMGIGEAGQRLADLENCLSARDPTPAPATRQAHPKGTS
ncbi:MAG: hypothetical protein IH608_09975 [Proteobacteria bacterium]|nr:hypothetical protein [Pseudomonadota bacterium]